MDTILNIVEGRCLQTLYTPINNTTRYENERKVGLLERKLTSNEQKNEIININNGIINAMFNTINIIQNHQVYQYDDIPTPLSIDDRKSLIEKKYSDLVTDDIKRPEIDLECSICRMEYEPQSVISILPCDGRHYYHKECIDEWLEQSKKCPICKADIEDVIHT